MKKIMDAGEEYTKHMGQYPVIFLSLKSAKQPTFEMAYLSLIDDIWNEFDIKAKFLSWFLARTSERFAKI